MKKDLSHLMVVVEISMKGHTCSAMVEEERGGAKCFVFKVELQKIIFSLISF